MYRFVPATPLYIYKTALTIYRCVRATPMFYSYKTALTIYRFVPAKSVFYGHKTVWPSFASSMLHLCLIGIKTALVIVVKRIPAHGLPNAC